MNPHTVINQPQMTVTQHQSCEWQTDLFDCFNDWGVCFCGMCCPLCLGCQIASELDECPLCGITMAFRTLYRTRYGIPGSLLSDYFATACCTFCSICQLKRDINKRKDRGIF
ncbi:placenta-specific gene 8 protein-like [Notechis scutatus]|uniref:Placenta-specific gene 8 protein-like n=1 Tax=Notechis scutatus TaxID=8663 RepID=A0A6J1VJ26_9SAUR|nr:placenta-specific gene 8 protein-like [Notechis scutatus]